MSYCFNPDCSKPVNNIQNLICEACGAKLLLGDRYQILRFIGKGGFGNTFLAADVSHLQPSLCVIKQLNAKRQNSSMGRKLFEREAKILRQIGDNCHIPQLIDYFEEQEQFYLVQDYIYGQNLQQEVTKQGVLNETQTKQALQELLLILQQVHSQNIIHRDVKPSNIIRRRKDGKLMLIDFGMVEEQASDFTSKNLAGIAVSEYSVGTRGYAPPEQLALRPVYASDIYSLGVTAIYLMKGKKPANIGINPMTGEVMWLKDLDISDSFGNILLKMLEVSVKNRYQSAEKVLQALSIVNYSF
ncbi:MAG: serine/threonine-protein kinase [Xenococcaceae cyanobacterium MO_188.B19]|nr:serine/threonine-protein kinase [Xenococcaceae cyanobacterium MO_188.B19]